MAQNVLKSSVNDVTIAVLIGIFGSAVEEPEGNLLLETGDSLLLETGDKLVLEATP